MNEGIFNESERKKAHDIAKSAKGALYAYGINMKNYNVNNNDQPEEDIKHTIFADGNDVYLEEKKRVLDIGKVGDLVQIYKGHGQQAELHEIIVKEEDGNKDLELITSSGRNGRYP